MNRTVEKLSSLMTLAVFALACASLTSAAEPKAQWQALFDGKTMAGWKPIGGATWKAENGELIATSQKGMGFLTSEKKYGDFILEGEVNIPPGSNSGFFFRGTPKGGRMIGYQAEVDSKADASGGFYDAKRRGWMHKVDKAIIAKVGFKADQWNKYRIEAIGDHIKVFVNGVLTTDLIDSLDLYGTLALQHHGEKGKTYRFRNLRIQDLGRHVWKPIFDGKTQTGWSPTPGGKWEVKEVEKGISALVGTSPKTDPRHGILLTDKTYKDFTVRVNYKSIKGNSGLYFRVEKVKHAVSVKGFQAEIDPNNDTGGLYETLGRAWVVKPEAKQVKKWYKPNAWNMMSVSAHGKRIVVHVNGHKTAELKDDPGRTEGHIGIQLHGGQEMNVMFRSIELLVPQAGAAAGD